MSEYETGAPLTVWPDEPSDQTKWCCIVACNSTTILESNLLASPDLCAGGVNVSVQRNKPNAGRAYNQGLDATSEPIVVFAHQDVYFPKGWKTTLQRKIQYLNMIDSDWAIAGVMGMTQDEQPKGQLWSTGLGRQIGEAFDAPIPACSLDEVVIILRRASELRFDEDLPSFHLYGTDIVQTAIQNGYGAYIINAPVVHNSRAVSILNDGFMSAYRYMQEKWSEALPIRTPVTVINSSGDAPATTNSWLHKHRWRRRLRRLPGLIRFAPDGVFGTPRPGPIARRLRYE